MPPGRAVVAIASRIGEMKRLFSLFSSRVCKSQFCTFVVVVVREEVEITHETDAISLFVQ